jgi:hypothetical protein
MNYEGIVPNSYFIISVSQEVDGLEEKEWSREQDWFWEGNVQSCVVEYIRQEEGFSILSSGQPVVAEQGLEIVAERTVGDRPVHRLVSVRGWPSQMCTKGALAGHLRATRPEVVARGWISQAILDLALSRGADPDVELSLALPTIAGYIRYLQRLRWFLSVARVWVYLVSQEGRVTVTAPGAAPVSAFTSSEGTGPLSAQDGKRRKLGLPGASRLQLPLLHALIMAGGTASRTESISAVAQWFPEVPQPPPTEFGQRLSIAQSTLQLEGLTELSGRGIWSVTEAGRLAHDAEWEDWLRKEDRET